MRSTLLSDFSVIFRRFFILATILILGLPLTTHAQFTFTTNNGGITITGYTGSDVNLIIPATTNGLPVTDIGFRAFLYASFNSVVIPDTVTTIEDQAFYACVSLTEIDVPASVTNIASTSFGFCYGVTNFSVDSSNSAYSSLNGVMFDKKQDLLFQYPENNAATNYSIPNSVASIGDFAFGYLRNLIGITIPGTVTNIGEAAFLGCITLANAVIPNSVVNVGDSAFDACENMTNVTIGAGVKYIGVDAFDNCASLASPLVIPESVVSIGSNAFTDCTSLPAITIGSGVTNFGVNALEFCSALTNIFVKPANPDYSSLNGVLFDKAQKTLIQFPTGLTANYVVSNSVTSIEDYAFYGSTKLFNITFDAGLTNIGNYAFYGCYNLSQVIIPDSVIAIGGEAFDGCDDVRSITFGENLTSIGAGAFYGCIVLPSVDIPDAVTNIGDQAFGDCSSLTGITIPLSNPAYTSSSGILFNKSQSAILQFPEAVGGSYAIPMNVNNIGDYSFAGCKLTAVTMPQTVTNIGNFAFYNDVITNLVIPDNVLNIGTEAFYGTAIKTIVVPNNVNSIGEDAFEYCEALTNAFIGAGVTNLGGDAFFGCGILTAAYFQGNAPTNDGTAFFEDYTTTVYYQPGTLGWGTNFSGAPSVPNPAAEVIFQVQPVGVVSNQFTMNLFGPAGSFVVIQATTELANPTWMPIATNTLSSAGTAVFQDSATSDFRKRFYRLKF